MEKSAGIVVFIGKGPRKYLLLHYLAGHWDFPKGHLESGETDEQAALRELAEETAISGITLVDGFREHLSYFFTKDKKAIHKQVVFFLGSANTSKVTISHEHVGFEWLPFDEAVKRITYDNSRKVLEKAVQFLDKVQ